MPGWTIGRYQGDETLRTRDGGVIGEGVILAP